MNKTIPDSTCFEIKYWNIFGQGVGVGTGVWGIYYISKKFGEFVYVTRN